MATLDVNVEVSARHVHLSQEDIEKLFGAGYELKVKKEIAGGFVAEERLTITGPKRSMERVAILGPARKGTQIELAATDARSLGVDAPIRLSGDLAGTPGIKLTAENGNSVETESGCIIAQRHVHLSEEDAAKLGVEQNQNVDLKIDTQQKRALVFGDVIVRIGGPVSVVHLDTDEGNAACTGRACVGTVIAE
ncbi:MAG: phosphate propanoyltransferase [Mogibacterium sp.]|uniref:phosphate propanoyltransferase n=1 Tax=Mogibacterium sp. TaxID=2049035 RepID=UPI001A4499E9|nr:phosphate propanoyltransferase [Mogibacterium sp.]MBL6468512.1 phosphate propanoyltransferase [Mogibacterium sp.]